MTVRGPCNSSHTGRGDGSRRSAGAPCWGHRAHLSLERGDPSTQGWGALKTLTLGALSSSMSSQSSMAVAELATPNHTAASAARGGSDTAPRPCRLWVMGIWDQQSEVGRCDPVRLWATHRPAQ